jgi:hypothetical protein
MSSEYSDQLKAFARLVNGEFSYGTQPSTTLSGKGWSKAEIRIPGPGKDIRYIAFSGTNSAEVYSGFYAEGKLPSGLFCRITEQDSFARLVGTFSSYKMKSGRPDFDKKLHIACNNKDFLLKLSRDHEVSGFLMQAIRRPLRFEVMTNEKGLLQEKRRSAMILSINTNEWMVDLKLLSSLLDGFRHLINRIG